MTEFLTGFAVSLVLAAVLWLWGKARGKGRNKTPLVFSSIEQMRAIGRLSVYKVLTKEIVTATDHMWGEIGSRYLSALFSDKKLSMIFEFSIDFHYDLQSSQFAIVPDGESSYAVSMPPCDYDVNIRNMRFYDEQASRFLPGLLGDFTKGFGKGFSEEDKNKLIDAAKDHAKKQALELISNVQSEVQKSAITTLESISRAFGAERMTFEFQHQITEEVSVDFPDKLSASA